MISKSLRIYFVTVQLLFGFNFGFVLKKTKGLANYSLINVGILSLLSISAVLYGPYFAYIHTTEYFLILVLLKRCKYTVYNFLCDLISLDFKWQMTISDCSTIPLWLYTFFMFCIKWIVSIRYAITFGTNDWRIIARIIFPTWPLTVLDVLPIVNILIFYKVYIRLNFLSKGLDGNNYKLKEAQAIFNDIADCFTKFRLHYDVVIFVILISQPMKLMLSIYYHLYYAEEKCDWTVHLFGLIYPLHHTVQIILPAVFAEMIGVQIDAMKSVLEDRLIMKQGEEAETLRFLGYLENCQLLRKVWRLGPLDLQLIPPVLDISVTYVIVIIQFTHLLEH